MRTKGRPLLLGWVVAILASLALLAVAPAGAAGTDDDGPLVEGPVVGPTVGTPPSSPTAVSAAAQDGTATGVAMTGTFRVEPGACGDGVDGSWFRMIQPGGDESGPFVQNSDSPCEDKSYTPLEPGRDGGLVTGTHQPDPEPPFDGGGNGLADRITRPQQFYGVDFATATNPVDPQTGARVPPPEVVDDGGRLGGDLRAFAVSWNRQHFNQGAPKPDGSRPAGTTGPTGTYDGDTGRYTLEWSSRIVGGPFDNFTGQWHLEGTFVPADAAGSPAAAPSRSPGPTAPAGGGTAASVGSTSRATATQSGGSLADTGPSVPTHLALLVLVVALAGVAAGHHLDRIAQPRRARIGTDA